MKLVRGSKRSQPMIAVSCLAALCCVSSYAAEWTMTEFETEQVALILKHSNWAGYCDWRGVKPPVEVFGVGEHENTCYFLGRKVEATNFRGQYPVVNYLYRVKAELHEDGRRSVADLDTYTVDCIQRPKSVMRARSASPLGWTVINKEVITHLELFDGSKVDVSSRKAWMWNLACKL